MNETIKRLKELREQLKTIPADAPISEGLAHWVVIADEIIAYLPQLFTYIEELEKKVEAGKVLAENVQRMGLHSGKQRKEWRAERDAALDTYNQAIE